jgi:predicted AAA+ superfamily ATPase
MHAENTWVTLNMDYLQERNLVEQGALNQMIIEGARYHIGSGKKIWVIIDEAQKCPSLFDQIKIIYDQQKDTHFIKFILTGSASLNLHNLCAESLAGRIELYFLNEFTLREATALKETLPLMKQSILDCLLNEDPIKHLELGIQEILPFKPLLDNQLNQHLIWGGLPEVILSENEAAKLRYLNNYLQTYLEKDIRSLDTVSDLRLFQQLMDIIAEQTGSIRDDQRIMQSLGCARDTLKKYRGILLASLVYTELYPYINSSLKRLIKSPKGYLRDNGLIGALTGLIDLQILQRTGAIGHRFENWLLGEITTWLNRQIQRNEIHYWRTAQGAEVDFVVNIKPSIYPFEATFSEHVDRKKVNNLSNFIKDEKIAWGFYVYRGEFQVDDQRKIIFIPAWAIG